MDDVGSVSSAAFLRNRSSIMDVERDAELFSGEWRIEPDDAGALPAISSTSASSSSAPKSTPK